MLRLLLALSLAHRALGRAVDLTTDNFDRLVFERKANTGPALVLFCAPEVKKCRKLKPIWEEVKKAHRAFDDALLVGSVECSGGEAKNPLCEEHDITFAPTLRYYDPPWRKGASYDGNLTMEELVGFAAELSSPCSLSTRHTCTEAQNFSLARYSRVPVHDLQIELYERVQGAAGAKESLSTAQQRIAKADEDESLSPTERDEQISALIDETTKTIRQIEENWRTSGEVRMMRRVLRERAPELADVNPLDPANFFSSIAPGGRRRSPSPHTSSLHSSDSIKRNQHEGAEEAAASFTPPADDFASKMPSIEQMMQMAGAQNQMHAFGLKDEV